MEFTMKKDIPFFSDCEPLVEGLGYKLVDLTINQQKGTTQIKVVIKSKTGVGVDDCATVHRALLPRLEALLGTQDTTMEVSSPGVNRIVKKSVELYAFIDSEVAIWDSSLTDWRLGVLKSINSDDIILRINDEDVSIPYKNIKKAKANL